MGKNKAEVKIRGRFYTITADEPEEYIYKIGAYVDKKITEMTKLNAHLSMDKVAILTAINISDELCKARASEDNLRAQIFKYDEEADAYEKRIMALEAEVKETKKRLEEKEAELNKFIEQF